jgi:GntR family transcriptional repressor for pyruvate dehydrogenase complex
LPENKFGTKALSSRVCESLIKQLSDIIQHGKLKPGEQLPPQEQLAQELGVSRTSLREALKELSYRGLIYSKHGIGTFVSNSFATEQEMLEARKYIETGTAFLAALRTSEADIQQLGELIWKMEESVKRQDLVAFSDLDCEFHHSIARASGNHVLQKVLVIIRDQVLEQQNLVQRLPGAMKRANLFHHKIFNAIKSHDADDAAELMRDHIEDVVRALSTISGKK